MVIMLKKMMILLACALGAVSFSHPVNAQELPVAETTSICNKWLSILDQGQYEQSWDPASSYFKSMVTKEQWTAQISAVRGSLGNVVSRAFQDQKYSTSLPGSPDGEYEIAQFSTVFKNKASSVETVVLTKDTDGQWRLAGYFIK
jgi:hypothetical protein